MARKLERITLTTQIFWRRTASLYDEKTRKDNANDTNLLAQDS